MLISVGNTILIKAYDSGTRYTLSVVVHFVCVLILAEGEGDAFLSSPSFDAACGVIFLSF